MKIEVSNGEILDKLSIIEIKLNRIKDEKKLKNIKIVVRHKFVISLILCNL